MAAGHSQRAGSLLMLDVLAANSGLRNVSPALKAAFSLGCLLLCVGAADAVTGAVVALSMVCVIWRLGRVPLGQILRLLRIPMLFLVISCLVLLLELTKAPVGLWHMRLGCRWLCVTEQSLHHSATMFFQALGAVTCLYFLGTSTPIPQLIEVLRKCHLPELMIEMMYLIYRYLFVLLDIQQKMTTAATTRLGYRGVRRSVHTAGLIGGGLLSSSFRRSSACFDAMEARCYTGKLAFLSHAPKLRPLHGLAAAGYISLLGLLILIRKGGLPL